MNIAVENEYGKRLELSNDVDFDVIHVSGLTPPIATIYTNPLTATDGDRYNRSRATGRNIVMTIAPRGTPERCRIKLYDVFKVKRFIKLFFTTEFKNVYIDGYVEHVDGDLFQNGQRLQISIICPYPYFREVADTITPFNTIIPYFEFPFAIEEEGIVFSEQVSLIENTIMNTGDDDCGMIIELEAVGLVLEPSIYNKNTRERFSFRAEMQSGDKITINSYSGEKSITLLRNGIETNIVNDIYLDSVWPKLYVGENVFTYTCVEGIDNLYITFKTNLVYGGL